MIGHGLITKGFGGLNLINDGTKTTILGVAGDYIRIGNAGSTSHSLASEDDLLVTGKLEIDGTCYIDSSIEAYGRIALRNDDQDLRFGAANYDAVLRYETADSDARCLFFLMKETADAGNNVPAFVYGEDANVSNIDLGLLDEVVEPHIVAMANSGQLVSITNASSGGAQTTITTATAGTFTSVAVGDVVRVTAGTNATVGWYIVDGATDQYNIVVDRNWCSGAVSSDGAVQVWHKMAMVTPKAIYLPTYDGAPSDSDIDINLAGAIAFNAIGDTDKGQIYWRGADGAWSYITKTGGLSMTKEERIDPKGKEFNIGDKVELRIDKINEDGSFHALPYRRD